MFDGETLCFVEDFRCNFLTLRGLYISEKSVRSRCLEELGSKFPIRYSEYPSLHYILVSLTEGRARFPIFIGYSHLFFLFSGAPHPRRAGNGRNGVGDEHARDPPPHSGAREAREAGGEHFFSKF